MTGPRRLLAYDPADEIQNVQYPGYSQDSVLFDFLLFLLSQEAPIHMIRTKLYR